MTNPTRIQLSRKKGFRLQDHSNSLNGLECVNVARPSKWGNPFKAGVTRTPDIKAELIDTAEKAVKWYSDYITLDPANFEIIKRNLKSKNLACWCALDAPCHADVLLKLANKG